MITIDTIKVMMRSSTTYEEHEEIYQILKEKKSEINRVMWETTEKIADKTADIPLNLEALKNYVESLDDKERILLEELATHQEKHATLLKQVEGLMKETHIKMRAFLL